MTPAETLNLAQKFREAIASANGDRIRDLVSSDAVIWYNQFGGPATTIGREQAIETILGMQNFVDGFTYTEVRVDPTPNGYVQQSIIRCKTRAGVEMTVPVCLIARVGADGKIIRYDEYRDSAHTAPLMKEFENAAAKARGA